MTEKEIILKAFERIEAEIIPIEAVRNYYEIRPKYNIETIGLTFDDEGNLVHAII